jgi:hypothetical protein
VPRQGATRCRNQQPTKPLHHGTVVHKLHKPGRRSLRSKEASTHTPPQHKGRPLVLTSLRGGLASPTATLSAKDTGNKRRE